MPQNCGTNTKAGGQFACLVGLLEETYDAKTVRAEKELGQGYLQHDYKHFDQDDLILMYAMHQFNFGSLYALSQKATVNEKNVDEVIKNTLVRNSAGKDQATIDKMNSPSFKAEFKQKLLQEGIDARSALEELKPEGCNNAMEYAVFIQSTYKEIQHRIAAANEQKSKSTSSLLDLPHSADAIQVAYAPAQTSEKPVSGQAMLAALDAHKATGVTLHSTNAELDATLIAALDKFKTKPATEKSAAIAA